MEDITATTTPITPITSPTRRLSALQLNGAMIHHTGKEKDVSEDDDDEEEDPPQFRYQRMGGTALSELLQQANMAISCFTLSGRLMVSVFLIPMSQWK
jgi:hypothetical protein